jgi:ketosteroid isomerase-like protein
MREEQQIRALIEAWAIAAHGGGLDTAYRDTWPPGTDVAFALALLRCGTPADLARDPDQRLRLTVGLRKAAGRRIVVHEHHSFPDTTLASGTVAPA